MSSERALAIELIPVLSDNYVYLITDAETDVVGVVDPGEAGPIAAAIDAREGDLAGKLDWILLTHHHNDHIGGVEALRAKYGAKVAGAKADRERLPKLDVALSPGEDWDFGVQIVEIIDAPGHTVGQIAYHFPRAKAVFTGDSLFALGCGRLFEGTALQMWEALKAFAKLPPETEVYCGHEYTEANAKFALTIETENRALQDRAREIETVRMAGKPTIPTTIGRELATNPFMRASEPSVKTAVGLPEADAAAVFAEIRRRKDAY
ncbi:MAG: hydroxyacylglutathione hydrolase [Pseudomonadota bacterium]